MYREIAEQKAEKEEREKANQPKKRGEKEFAEEQRQKILEQREREESGHVKQCNEGKWKFHFDEDERPGYVLLDVGVQKHLSSSLIDVDVNPSYVSVIIKSKTLRLTLPAEVESESAKACRSKTTGHLLITMKKVDPKENMIALRAARKAAEKKVKEAKEREAQEKLSRKTRGLGAQMVLSGGGELSTLTKPNGAVSLNGMVSRSKGGIGLTGNRTFDEVGLVAKEVKRVLKVGEQQETAPCPFVETVQSDGEDSDEPPEIC